MSRFKGRKLWFIILPVILIVLVALGLLILSKERTVTINGVAYKGMSQQQAEAAYVKKVADSSHYEEQQKEKCQQRGDNYIYVAKSNECMTYDEYKVRDRIAQKSAYEKKQAVYKNDPKQEVLDAYNDYENVSTVCKSQIMESAGYSNMYEIADAKAQSKITKANIMSINGNDVQLKIDVDFVPGVLTQSNSSLHQNRASFKGKICAIDMQKDFRDNVEAYFNQ